MCLVFLSPGIIAVSFPDLSDLIGLVGAFSGGFLAFVFPPILEFLTHWPERGRGYWWLIWFIKDVAIIMVGLIGCVFGTYSTLVNLVKFRQII